MEVAGAVADLIDIQGSSVLVCLENGWDATAQVRGQGRGRSLFCRHALVCVHIHVHIHVHVCMYNMYMYMMKRLENIFREL